MQFLCCALFAQRFVNTSLDGAQTVCSITQDAQGLIWLGTDNGLYSYDGYHSYRHYADHAFSNTRVNALAFDKAVLFLATGNGILQFDTQQGRYQHTPSIDDFNNPAKRKTLKESRALDLQNKKTTFGNDVYALLHTPKGLLMGSISGLYLSGNGAQAAKNPGKASKRLIPLCPGAQPLVNALMLDTKRHCYWIGTEGALYCADLALRNFSKVAALDGNSVKCLAEEANGTLYIGTDNGLYSMAMNNAINHYTHDTRDAFSIPNNIVWACFVDKWQNVWVGTDNGLSRLSTHTYYQYVSLDKITLTGEGNCLHAIYQTRNGDWWMGGTNGLIHNDVWYRQNNPAYPLSHNRVRKIYEDHDGDLWIATDHGINLYNPATRQMRNFIIYDKTGKYSTAWAYDILQDRQGRLWMASYMGGIFVINKQAMLAGKTIADYHFSDQGKNALSGLHVGQLVMDGKGRIWASTYNSLDCINPNSMRVLNANKADVINYLMVDSKGNVWVGDNSGVKCYYASTPMMGSEFASKEWKIGSKVSTMCDVDGKIWVVTGNECCVLDDQGESFRFVIPSLSPLAVFYSKSSHKVLMAGNDGFVSIRSNLTMPTKQQAQLLLAGVMVNGKPMQETALEQFADGSTIASYAMKEIVLNSDENNFTLQLSDLPFGDHPSSVYAYQLEGSDHDWHYLKNGDLDITYNGLSYGDYRLTVHVVDGEGKVGDEVYSLNVSVLPPWYLSWWAKLFYITALIVFVAWVVSYYFLRRRLEEEQKQKAEILEQVDARMSFYTRLTDGLKAAVAHRSFDEVIDLMSRMLDVDAKSLMAASQDEPSAEPETDELNEAEGRLLHEINEAIESHMVDSDFNVTMLQEVLGMGNKQLYRKVKALTGKTPVEYIRELRMQKAAKLLKAGKFSVSEVMYTVGFSNSSYFSKCFSKVYGMTPTEYMKKS